jgi:cation transport regulator ChaB
MRYATIEELPTVWRLNLPEAAQHVYKDAFNRAWAERRDERHARNCALAEVRRRFVKDPLTGRWVARQLA